VIVLIQSLLSRARPISFPARYFLGRLRHDADLRDEIEPHRAYRQDALERDGLASDAAAWPSQRAMGNVTRERVR
jgi:hypothetical protein